MLRSQLAENGATGAEIAILLNERVELNAMPSDDLVAMIERKLTDYGLEKVIPDDELLTEAYQAFHHSNELRDVFKKARGKYEDEENAIDIPKNLRCQVRAVLQKNRDLRWDEALQVVVDETQLDRVRTEKKKARTKAGDFTDNDDEEGEDWGDDDDGD